MSDKVRGASAPLLDNIPLFGYNRYEVILMKSYDGSKIQDIASKSKVAPLQTFTADEVWKIRTSLGLTQQAFGELVGMSDSAVQSWESGRSTPSKTVSRLLEIIQKDPSLPRRMNLID